MAVSALSLSGAAGAGALLLGLRARADVITAALCMLMLGVTLLSKALLLAGLYGGPGVAALSVAAAAAVLVPALATGRGRRRLRAGAGIFPGAPFRPWTPPAVTATSVLAVVALTATVAVYTYRTAMALLLPPRDVDSLWYHLVSVAGWVQKGNLSPAIENLSKAGDPYWTVASDTYPRDFELVVAWFAVFTRNTTFVGLTQIVFAVLLFSGTYGICRRLRVRPAVCVTAACSVVLAPAVIGQVYTVYNDVARAAVAAAVWHLLLIALGPRSLPRPRVFTAGLLAFAGAVLGFGLGVKTAGAYLLPFAVLSALVLRWRLKVHGEPVRLSPPAVVASLLVPAGLVGCFWYLLTWHRWGSPVWPIKIGPFPGVLGVESLTDAQRPGVWKHTSHLELLLHSWFDGVYSLGEHSWYAEWTGQLGAAWLLVMIPAVTVLVVLTVMHRRHVTTTAAVVLPLLVGTLAAPGQWFSRYTIPVLIAGAVAVAVLCGTREPKVEVRPLPEQLDKALSRVAGRLPGARALILAGLVAVTLAGTVGGLRWTNYKPAEDPGARGWRQVVGTMALPAGQRGRLGSWGRFPEIQAMPDGTRIGFCAEDVPQAYAPFMLIGQRFQRDLVDLGLCRTPAGVRAAMARYDVDYLYTTGGSPQDSRFRATGVTGFQPLTAKARRQTETESYIRMYRLTPVAAGDARQHEAFAPFRKRTGVLNATDAAGRHR